MCFRFGFDTYDVKSVVNGRAVAANPSVESTASIIIEDDMSTLSGSETNSPSPNDESEVNDDNGVGETVTTVPSSNQLGDQHIIEELPITPPLGTTFSASTANAVALVDLSSNDAKSRKRPQDDEGESNKKRRL